MKKKCALSQFLGTSPWWLKKIVKLKQLHMSKWGTGILAKMTRNGNVFQLLCILKISSQVHTELLLERKLKGSYHGHGDPVSYVKEDYIGIEMCLPLYEAVDKSMCIFPRADGSMRWYSVLFIFFILEPFHTSVWKLSLPLFKLYH